MEATETFAIFANYPQFILYKIIPSQTRLGKSDKIPVNYLTGIPCDAHDKANWLALDEALKYFAKYNNTYGVGFVFTKDDPFFFLDLDNCIDDTGAISHIAGSLREYFKGCFIETSNSRNGLHIIGTISDKTLTHRTRDIYGKDLELYTHSRFCALTGIDAQCGTVTPCDEQFKWIVDNYFPADTVHAAGTHEWTNEPREGWAGNEDDEQLINRALRSKSKQAIFSGQPRITFRDLWECNVDMLSTIYPSANSLYDASQADSALAFYLAWWTGNNCERILRLMLQSSLRRDKWERDDYLPRTIAAACGRQTSFLKDLPVQNIALGDKSQVSTELIGTKNKNRTIYTDDEQIEMFRGCGYIADVNKIFTPNGDLLNQDQFKSVFGGRKFIIDREGKTTKNAWDAFIHTELVTYPKVFHSCFKPKETPGVLIAVDSEIVLNTYVPAIVKRSKGDPSRFLRLLEKLLPNEEDRAYLLAYLAAAVQYIGYKFQWCPLIQGVEGNGKTTITRFLAYAVGQKFVHFPSVQEICGRFNGWIARKLLICIEDIYSVESRSQTIETLKPLITNDMIEVESKGVDKITIDNYANFIINTNHKDGLRKSENDRRFAPFFTAQQCVADLRRDGLTSQFFKDLRAWQYEQNGMAIVADFLACYDIPSDLNPAYGNRAPITSSTAIAIKESLGTIEQEILEAIADERIGFKGGWVSSIWLNKLMLEVVKTKISPRRKHEIMLSIGFIYHPRLIDGRSTTLSTIDNGKPRLYIKADHADRKIHDCGKIIEAYEAAQKR